VGRKKGEYKEKKTKEAKRKINERRAAVYQLGIQIGTARNSRKQKDKEHGTITNHEPVSSTSLIRREYGEERKNLKKE